MIGLLFLLVGYFVKYCGLAMVWMGDIFITVGMWLQRLPGKVWQCLRKRKR